MSQAGVSPLPGSLPQLSLGIRQARVNTASAFTGEGAWGTENEPACLLAALPLAKPGLGHAWWLLLHQCGAGG